MQMSSNRLFDSLTFSRVVIAVLLIWIASAVFGIYLLNRFDLFINSQLYYFGLQFDHAWADTYYFYTQLMYITLAAPIALTVISIAAGFKRQTKKTSEPAPKLVPNLTRPQPQPVVTQGLKAEASENKNGMRCPSCKKVFSRPRVMLSIKDGKKRPVNVCPYCRHKLGDAEDNKISTSEFQVADSDEKLIH